MSVFIYMTLESFVYKIIRVIFVFQLLAIESNSLYILKSKIIEKQKILILLF